MREKFVKTIFDKTATGEYRPPKQRAHINSIQTSMLYPEEREIMHNKAFTTIAELLHAYMHLEQKITTLTNQLKRKTKND